MNILHLSLLLSLLTLALSVQFPILNDDDPFHEPSSPRVYPEFEHMLPLPPGWNKDFRRVDPKTPITLTWALKQRNLDVLDRIFNQVSDPKSELYGKHRTLFDLADLVAPSKADIEGIMEWLDSFSPLSKHLTLSRDFIVTKFPVETAERMLQVTFSYFHHPQSGLRYLRTLQPYTLPKEISEKVDFVGGVNRLFPVSHGRVAPTVSDSNAAVTPISIRARYNVTDIGSSPKNLMGTSQFLEQWYSPADLSQFFATYSLPDYPVTKVIGKNNVSEPGVEASLDIQYLMGVAQNIPTYFYFTDGYDNDGQEPFLEWIISLNEDPNTPLVNSVSYGDFEITISAEYLDRCNVEFQKFGASGHSLLFASGDWGVGCEGTQMSPLWPSSSPYVTSVGGTQMSGNEEVGVTFSGGGFSNHFAQPSYQKDAVAAYFKTVSSLPPASTYNSSGRAYPDVAAFATNYQVVVGGQTKNVGGTSASTPTISGIVSLLNDARLNNGLPALGFLNPLIYSVFAESPEAYYDVTSGSNPYLTCAGFYATRGWDPITGVGTPNYSVLKQLATN